MRLLIFIIFLGLSNTGFTQFTLSYKYDQNSVSDWEDIVTAYTSGSESIVGSTHNLAVGYWLKPLKEYRWNVIPEISYGQSKSEINASETLNAEHKWNTIELTINNLFYPLNMESDCNCPTFSKDGNFFTKGFFVNASIGYALNQFTITSFDQEYDSSSNGLKLGIGMGIDIGINDLLTLSPIINYNFRPQTEWEELRDHIFGTSPQPSNYESLENSTTVTQWEFGIRANFRFDYLRENRRW